MTICLAAIAKEVNEEYIVFATDHMVTTSLGQFEHSIVKYQQLNNNTVAMLAGDPLLFDDLVKLKDSKSPYEQIKLEIFENMKKKRKEIIKNEIFEMYGVNQQFFIDSLQKPVPNPYIDMILRKVSDFKLETGILLIGFNEGEAQITEINDLGIADFRVMNFHAIGSGNIQAANTLLFQKHDKCDALLPTVYNVYKAKKNAEVLQGVGKETELLILSQKGCLKIEKEDLETLRLIYAEELNVGKKHKNLNTLKIKDKIGGSKCFSI